MNARAVSAPPTKPPNNRKSVNNYANLSFLDGTMTLFLERD
jgi:hypothetical protein